MICKHFVFSLLLNFSKSKCKQNIKIPFSLVPTLFLMRLHKFVTMGDNTTEVIIFKFVKKLCICQVSFCSNWIVFKRDTKSCRFKCLPMISTALFITLRKNQDHNYLENRLQKATSLYISDKSKLLAFAAGHPSCEGVTAAR